MDKPHRGCTRWSADCGKVLCQGLLHVLRACGPCCQGDAAVKGYLWQGDTLQSGGGHPLYVAAPRKRQLLTLGRGTSFSSGSR